MAKDVTLPPLSVYTVLFQRNRVVAYSEGSGFTCIGGNIYTAESVFQHNLTLTKTKADKILNAMEYLLCLKQL